jgi:hypothetical protein
LSVGKKPQLERVQVDVDFVFVSSAISAASVSAGGVVGTVTRCA